MKKPISWLPVAVLIILSAICITTASAATVRECQGNIETFDKKVIEPGVSYKIWYEISGDRATVRVAGRNIDAEVAKHRVWNGAWIRFAGESDYLSFWPDDGGTIKLELNTNYWFSGNCL